MFWYLLCKASQVCFPSLGLRNFGSNCSNTLCAAHVLVNLKTLNRSSLAAPQALMSSTLEGSRSLMLPVSLSLPSIGSSSLLVRIGSGFSESILLRKGPRCLQNVIKKFRPLHIVSAIKFGNRVDNLKRTRACQMFALYGSSLGHFNCTLPKTRNASKERTAGRCLNGSLRVESAVCSKITTVRDLAPVLVLALPVHADNRLLARWSRRAGTVQPALFPCSCSCLDSCRCSSRESRQRSFHPLPSASVERGPG